MSTTASKIEKRNPPPSAAEKPGERTPPVEAMGARMKAQPERKKPAGIGGAPSPVGENDLA
ncbi:MAG: hypothetical protein H2042_00375 [Rhizobiales bacterium]|nr:hypothetical protein [Hyphomicrobiales bacterium]